MISDSIRCTKSRRLIGALGRGEYETFQTCGLYIQNMCYCICRREGKNIISLVANLPYVNSLSPVNKGFGVFSCLTWKLSSTLSIFLNNLLLKVWRRWKILFPYTQNLCALFIIYSKGDINSVSERVLENKLFS